MNKEKQYDVLLDIIITLLYSIISIVEIPDNTKLILIITLTGLSIVMKCVFKENIISFLNNPKGVSVEKEIKKGYAVKRYRDEYLKRIDLLENTLYKKNCKVSQLIEWCFIAEFMLNSFVYDKQNNNATNVCECLNVTNNKSICKAEYLEILNRLKTIYETAKFDSIGKEVYEYENQKYLLIRIEKTIENICF